MTEQGYGNNDPFAHQIPASDEYAHVNTGKPNLTYWLSSHSIKC